MTKVIAVTLATASFLASAWSFQKPAPVDPWTAADVISTDDFAKQPPAHANSQLLYVGFPVLYRSAHIPGSKYAGPGAKAEGIAELKKVLAGVPRTERVVLYCGCCPWTQCPNVRPAWQAAHDMGFKDIKVMMIPTNLRTDWTDKGYPVERSHGQTDDSGSAPAKP